ncbi:MAG: type II secretion system F family protein, partial [Cryobacterium sp.]
MPSLIAILSSLAVAGGLAALIGIFVGGRAVSPAMDLEDTPPNLVTSGAARVRRARGMRELAPFGYLGMLERRLALAGWPPAWTIDRILIVKPLAAAAGALLAVLWISDDPAPTRFVLGSLLVLLCFFVPDLLLISRGQERQEKIQHALADTLDQMTIAVEAGLGFEAAMAK